MTTESFDRPTPPLSFHQKLEARMQFDPETIEPMLAFNSECLQSASDPEEIARLMVSEGYLRELLQRMQF